MKLISLGGAAPVASDYPESIEWLIAEGLPERGKEKNWGVIERFNRGCLDRESLYKLTSAEIQKPGTDWNSALACVEAFRWCHDPDTKEKECVRPGRFVFSAAMMKAKDAGELDVVLHLFNHMQVHGEPPDDYIYSLAIAAAREARLPEAALELYEHFKGARLAADIPASTSIFNSLISAIGGTAYANQIPMILKDGRDWGTFQPTFGFNREKNELDLHEHAVLREAAYQSPEGIAGVDASFATELFNLLWDHAELLFDDLAGRSNVRLLNSKTLFVVGKGGDDKLKVAIETCMSRPVTEGGPGWFPVHQVMYGQANPGRLVAGPRPTAPRTASVRQQSVPAKPALPCARPGTSLPWADVVRGSPGQPARPATRPGRADVLGPATVTAGTAPWSSVPCVLVPGWPTVDPGKDEDSACFKSRMDRPFNFRSAKNRWVVEEFNSKLGGLTPARVLTRTMTTILSLGSDWNGALACLEALRQCRPPVRPNAQVLTAAMRACVSAHRADLALHLFNRMVAFGDTLGARPDDRAYSMAISASGKAKRPDVAWDVYQHFKSYGAARGVRAHPAIFGSAIAAIKGTPRADHTPSILTDGQELGTFDRTFGFDRNRNLLNLQEKAVLMRDWAWGSPDGSSGVHADLARAIFDCLWKHPEPLLKGLGPTDGPLVAPGIQIDLGERDSLVHLMAEHMSRPPENGGPGWQPVPVRKDGSFRLVAAEVPRPSRSAQATAAAGSAPGIAASRATVEPWDFNHLLKAEVSPANQTAIELFNGHRLDADQVIHSTVTCLTDLERTNDWEGAIACLKALTRCNRRNAQNPGRWEGVHPDLRCYRLAMQACANAGQCEKTWSLLTLMRQRRVSPDAAAYNIAMSAFLKRGLPGEALRAFGHFNQFGSTYVPAAYPDTTTWNLAMDALVKQGRAEEALQLFRRLPRSFPNGAVIGRDATSFRIAMSAQLAAGRPHDALSLMAQVSALDASWRPPVRVTAPIVNAALDAHMAAGRPDLAQQLLTWLVDHGSSSASIAPDLDSFVTMMSGWAKAKQPRRVIALYDQLQAGRCGALCPDARTISLALGACHEAGLESRYEEIILDGIDGYRSSPETRVLAPELGLDKDLNTWQGTEQAVLIRPLRPCDEDAQIDPSLGRAIFHYLLGRGSINQSTLFDAKEALAATLIQCIRSAGWTSSRWT